jgi:hypothetical protein
MATCQADGTQGALCRTVDPFCDTNLTCSSTDPTVPGVCRSTSALAMTCDPSGRSSICATPAVCGIQTDGNGLCVTAVDELTTTHDLNAPQGPVTTNTVYNASINPGDQMDCFTVTVPQGGSLILRTGDGMGGCAQGVDTVLHLFAPSGNVGDGGITVDGGMDSGVSGWTEIGTNDDIANTDYCSMLDGSMAGTPGHALPAGTYAACVESYHPATGSPMVIAQYYLDIAIVP